MKYIKTFQVFETRVKKQDRIDLYRDDKYIVVSPLTYEASCKYGAFTKWCISVPHAEYVWDGGKEHSKIVFILQKKYIIPEEKDKKIEQFLELKDKMDNEGLTKREEKLYLTLLSSGEAEDLSKIAIIFNKKNDLIEIWDANNINLDDNYSTIEQLPIDRKVVDVIYDYFFPDDNVNENLDYNHREYLKWKRKNVTFRGMREINIENGVASRFGDGLYQAYLSNKSFAKSYGTVYFVVNGRPKHPKIVQSPNYAEIAIQNVIYNYCKEHKLERLSDFYNHTTVKDEMLKLGWDGLDIIGCELVNYKPNMDEIKYFRTEEELKEYYINNVKI